MQENNFKLTIAYDGTNYGGWQIQPNAPSIQELVHLAIHTVLRQPVTLIGSGRTDAGVHALGQVAHFKFPGEINLEKFIGSLNGLLPDDIRILHAEKVPSDFHAQRSAISKVYYYNLSLGRVQLPFQRLYSLHIHDDKFDLELLKKASQLFVGTHDFTSFANEAHAGCAARNPVRNLFRIDITPQEGGVRIEFEANGFLYKMVRNIVGTLLEVARGKRSIDDIPRLFEACDRRQAGQAAPPHGLFLAHVIYDNTQIKRKDAKAQSSQR